MEKSYRQKYKKTQLSYWKNFWYYNRWIIIAVTLVIAALVYFIASCRNMSRPDATIFYVTKYGISSAAASEIETTYSKYVQDINNDGKTEVKVIEIVMSDDLSEGVKSANVSRLNTEIINGDSAVIIGEKSLLNPFINLDDYFEIPHSAKYKTILNKNGKATALDITDSKFAKMAGYDKKDTLCMLVKGLSDAAKADSLSSKMWKEGIKIADAIAAK
ncbi:MAG: hypothetical protein Q8873_01895 [Bacillota bacterium]|nr:hypothetical protein [Bacillota bacterium]